MACASLRGHGRKRSGKTSDFGLLCSLCQRHQARPQNGSGTWIGVPCTRLRTDVLQCHKRPEMHCESQRRECLRLASERNGGIRQAFSVRVVANRKALIGPLQILVLAGKGRNSTYH